ncbi:MAG TPA: hypothetical protein VF552_07995 [Allosphingosinicella sp.]|jgi:hypothetical protein
MPFRSAAARHAFTAALLATALLAGCAPEGEFPSLALRPIEAEDPREEPVRTPPVVASDPALRARAAELLGQARSGETAFGSAYGRAAAAARAAGAPGSESWVVAQEAISRVEAARAATTRALADLDRLSTERAGLPTNEEDFAVIGAALAEAARLVRGQQERFDALRASAAR